MDLELYRKLAGTYDVSSSEENAINQFVKQSDKIYDATLSMYDVLAPSKRGDDVKITNSGDESPTESRAVFNYDRNFDVETMPTGLERVYFEKDSVDVGTLVEKVRTGKLYLVESKDENRYEYDDTYVRLAGDEIKWKDENGDTITVYASKEILSESSTGIVEGDSIRILRAKLKVMVQSNDDTVKLTEGRRIFMGRHVYEISYIDDFTLSGILSIYFKHDDINKDVDDTTNGIADVDDGDNDDPSNPW